MKYSYGNEGVCGEVIYACIGLTRIVLSPSKKLVLSMSFFQ
jgi:hypothetical protein